VKKTHVNNLPAISGKTVFMDKRAAEKKQGAEGEPGANVHGFHGFRREELSAAYLGTDSSFRLHPKISAS
jgi:hypothetical protein